MENKLLELRIKNNLTQKQMAKKLETTLTFYTKIELGVRNPSYNFIKKIKKAFPEISVDEIFFEVDTHVM